MIASTTNARYFDSDDCPRSTVIRRILATTPEISECELMVPGISTGLWTQFAAYFDFGNDKLLPISVFPDGDLLKLVDDKDVRTLCPYRTFDPETRLLDECVGAYIEDVLTSPQAQQVYFKISNDTVIWMEVEVNGMSLRCEKTAEFDGVGLFKLDDLNSVLK